MGRAVLADTGCCDRCSLAPFAAVRLRPPAFVVLRNSISLGLAWACVKRVLGRCHRGSLFILHGRCSILLTVNVELRDAWHRHNAAHFSWYGQHSFTTESGREVVERKRGKCGKRECCREVLQ